MPPAAAAQPATTQVLAPQPPAPPLARVHLACCFDGSVQLVLAVVGEEWVRLELVVQPSGAVAATLTVTSSGSTTTLGPAAPPAAALLPAHEPAVALEQDAGNQEAAAEALLRQQHSALLQENGRLQCFVWQHLDGISKASRKSVQEAVTVAPQMEGAQQRYLLALQQLRRLMAAKAEAQAAAERALAPERARLEAADAAAAAHRAAWLRFVGEVAAAGGRAAAAGQARAAVPDRILQHFLAAEPAKAAEGRALRLAAARLAYQLAAAERRLKDSDQLSAEGLHLVDFEQLRIENAALAEKREARRVELERLRGKLVQAVQVSAHCREKLHCVELQGGALAAALEAAEARLHRARERLTAAKAQRERARREREGLAQDWRIVSDPRCRADWRAQAERLAGLQAQAAALQAQYEAAESGTSSIGAH